MAAAKEVSAIDRDYLRYPVESFLCGLFARDNPRFDKERFLAACMSKREAEALEKERGNR